MELVNEFNLKKIEETTKEYLSKLDLQTLINESAETRDKLCSLRVRLR